MVKYHLTLGNKGETISLGIVCADEIPRKGESISYVPRRIFKNPDYLTEKGRGIYLVEKVIHSPIQEKGLQDLVSEIEVFAYKKE